MFLNDLLFTVLYYELTVHLRSYNQRLSHLLASRKMANYTEVSVNV